MTKKGKTYTIFGFIVAASIGVMIIPGAFFYGLIALVISLTIGLPTIFYDFPQSNVHEIMPTTFCAPECV